MNTETLHIKLSHLTTEYINGLDYIRNNPDISVEEVRDHLKVMKERREIMELLEQQ